MQGIIDCFESDFSNYIPNTEDFVLLNSDPENPAQEELWVFHETLKNKRNKPQRIAFNNHLFCWFYFDLRQDVVRKKMLRRVDKMYDYLSTTNDRVIFIRSVLEADDLKMVESFHETINTKFPKLDWHLVFLHDQHDNLNTSKPCHVHKNEYTFINATTHPSTPDVAYDMIKRFDDFKDIKISDDQPVVFESTLTQNEYFNNANITQT